MSGDLVVHKRNVKRLLERVRLDATNSKLLMNYYHQMLSEGLSELRIVKCLQHLLVAFRMLKKSFNESSREELTELLARIRQRKVKTMLEPSS